MEIKCNDVDECTESKYELDKIGSESFIMLHVRKVS